MTGGSILSAVRTTLAALLACLFVMMATADLVACQDGCTDESPAQAAAGSQPSACTLCHGWNSDPVVVVLRPIPHVTAPAPPVAADPIGPVVPTIELPPERA